MPSFNICKYSFLRNSEWAHCPYRTEVTIKLVHPYINVYWRKIVIDTIEVTTHTVLLGVSKYPTIALKLSLISGATLRRVQMVFRDVKEFDAFKSSVEKIMHCHVHVKKQSGVNQSQSQSQLVDVTQITNSPSLLLHNLHQYPDHYTATQEAETIPQETTFNTTYDVAYDATQPYDTNHAYDITQPYNYTNSQLPSPECSQVPPLLNQPLLSYNMNTSETSYTDQQLRDIIKTKLEDEKFIEFVKKVERIVTSSSLN